MLLMLISHTSLNIFYPTTAFVPFLFLNDLLSILMRYVLITINVLSYSSCDFENSLYYPLQHGSSFWFWGYVFIGKWHGWTKSGSECSHFWTFLCTCSRWTFPGRHEKMYLLDSVVDLYYFVPPFGEW